MLPYKPIYPVMQPVFRTEGLRESLISDMPFLGVGDRRDFGMGGNTFENTEFGNSPIGPCLDFSDSSARIILPHDETINYPVSVEFVFTPTTLSGTQQILLSWPDGGSYSTNPQTLVIINPGHDELSFGANATYKKSVHIDTIKLGVPNHLIVVWTGSPASDNNAVGYINGVDATESASDYWGSDDGSSYIQLGKREGGSAYPFTGKLHSFKMWDREISEEEALLLYSDPWAAYRDSEEDMLIMYAGALHTSTPAFNPFWAMNSNQVI
jgi:hypothetical protein